MAMGDVERYIAELQNAIAQGRLQLDRDIYQNIQLPTYQNVTLPSSIAANTGMLPGGYVGGYGGKASAPFLESNINMMGQVGDTADQRITDLGYAAGQRTLAGRELDLRGDAQRASERQFGLQFDASRSDADRAYAEAVRARVQQQQAEDFRTSLEAGVPVLNGSPMPAWMQPHQEWARNFQMSNGGRVPTYADLVGALAPSGRVPEDYNGGQPYPGQPPAAGPGILYEPARGGYLDAVSGKVLDPQTAAATIRDRQGYAQPMTVGPDGAPTFANRPGTAAAPLGAALPSGVAATGGGVRPDAGDGATMRTMDLMTRPLPAYAGPTVGTAGAATAAIGQGAPMSQAQRELIERGRQADLQNAQAQNAQRIQEKQVEYQNAVAQGNLELANRAQTELTDLNNRKLELERQGQEFQQGIAAGALTGSYNGQRTVDQQRLDLETGRAIGTVNGSDTLEKGGLMGEFNGKSTLAGQIAYGGKGLVDSGMTLEAGKAIGQVGGVKTLEAQQAENQTALGYLNLLGGLRGPENAFQYLKVLNSTPGGLRDLTDAAAGRYKMGQFGGGDPSALRAATPEGLLGGTTAAGAGAGAPASFGALPAYRGPASGVAVSSSQWAPQNIAKMDDYQRSVLLAQEEAKGHDPNAALAAFKATLPRYAGPSRAAVRPY